MNSAATMAAKILDEAERLTQQVGYNGLSFRDIAASVGIKSSSVHYHFPSKALLGAAIARRYTDRLIDYLAEVDARQSEPAVAMAAYIDVFRSTLETEGRMCLCGMLAAETDAIPDGVREEVRRFVDCNVDWISRTIGRATGQSPQSTALRENARALFAALEGAMLVARGTGDIASFDAITKQYERVGLLGC